MGQADDLWCRLEGLGEASLLNEPQNVQGGDVRILAARQAELEPRVQAVARVRLALRAQSQDCGRLHAAALQATHGAEVILW